LDKFEKGFADYCGRIYGLACSNGTTALHLALLALGIGPGDEVIVPALTFSATAATVMHVGAKPVFVDVNENNWTLNESRLIEKVTPKTKAVIAVDLYGLPCNYDFLAIWCKQKGIYLIEDAAEAHGALYHNKRVGSFGDVSCFSFYGNKIITTGEGGMCLTDNQGLYEKMKVFKNHGMRSAGDYTHEIAGYNYRLTNVQAAIGCAQLERIEQFLKKRAENYQLYRELLSNIPGLIFQEYNKQEIQPAWWLISFLVSGNIDIIREELKIKNIDSRKFFSPLPTQPAYIKLVDEADVFSVSDNLAKYGLSLPSSPLLTVEEIYYICDELKKILQKI
jgi:perosamine synthetase